MENKRELNKGLDGIGWPLLPKGQKNKSYELLGGKLGPSGSRAKLLRKDNLRLARSSVLRGQFFAEATHQSALIRDKVFRVPKDGRVKKAKKLGKNGVAKWKFGWRN